MPSNVLLLCLHPSLPLCCLCPSSLLPCHRHRSLCYTLHLQGSCATHAHTHTHTLSQSACILPSTDARRITVRERPVNICSRTMMRLAESRIIYSVTSCYGCLSYINSLPLFIPPCPSLTHSLPPPLVFCRTVFSLPPSVYPLLVLLTLCRVLSLILLFFHTLLPSHSSLSSLFISSFAVSLLVCSRPGADLMMPLCFQLNLDVGIISPDAYLMN